jgi:g-D-glutamyl-meso-diaminopimelate peptidase
MKVEVRRGDTLWYYSNLFRVPLDLLIDSNSTIHPSNLEPSQEIRIPGFQMIPYKIQKGDTLSKLAQARNLSMDAIVLLNKRINPDLLSVDETIFLPHRIGTTTITEKKGYTFDILLKDINDLKKIFPFIKIQTIGKSVQGLPIQEIRIGRGKKKIHFNASFHANEWITSSVLMKLVNSYLLSLTNGNPVKGLATFPYYYQTELSIVPMVNPDGVNLVLKGPPVNLDNEVVAINDGSLEFTGWKANIRGVDLNNQYPANWLVEKKRKEPKSPASRDFPGEEPLSEPEAIALAELTKTRQFDRVIALHSQGKEFYWGYEGLEPFESRELALEFEKVSGYKAIQNVDSHAGYKDWFIQNFRKPGFTIELGKGINPLPLSQFDEIYDDVLGIFLAALYM